MIDWNKVIEQAFATAALIVPAWLAGAYKLRVMARKQESIERKVDGNHRVTMKAIRAQGRLEGIEAGKKLVHEDLDHATKVIAKASKRGTRRSTDK